MKKYVLGLTLFVGLWWILSAIVGSEIILPSPMAVLGSLKQLVISEVFYKSLFSTLLKGFLATFFVIAIGVPVGMFIGLSEAISQILRPFVSILQSVPVISWLALAIFMWGIGWKGPVLLTTLSLLPVVIINTASGVLNVDRELVEMSKVYNVPKAKVFKVIYMGSLLPFMIASLQITLGSVWKTILVTEFLCGDEGLGVMIAWARSYVDTPQIFAITLIAVTFSLTLERLSHMLFGKVLRRWRLS